MEQEIITGQSLIHHTDEIMKRNQYRYNPVFNNEAILRSLFNKTYRATNLTERTTERLNVARARTNNIDKDLKYFSSGLVSGYMYGLTQKEKAKIDMEISMFGRSRIYELHEPYRPKSYGYK